MRTHQTRFFVVALTALFLCSQSTLAMAKTETKEVNKIPRPPAGPPEIPGAKALAELKAAQKRNNELAVQHFSSMVQKDAKDSASFAARGKAYFGLGEYDKAKADFEKALQLDPKQVEAYKGRAVLRYTKHDLKGSREDAKKAEELGSPMWASFLNALKQSEERKK